MPSQLEQSSALGELIRNKVVRLYPTREPTVISTTQFFLASDRKLVADSKRQKVEALEASVVVVEDLIPAPFTALYRKPKDLLIGEYKESVEGSF